MEDNLLHAISKLRRVQFHVVTKVLGIFKVAQCTRAHRDQRMCQVVTHKRLKTIENHKAFRPKKWLQLLTRGGHLLEVL